MTTLEIVSFFAGFATAVAIGYMIGKRNRRNNRKALPPHEPDADA